jgi:hypothetical protein
LITPTARNNSEFPLRTARDPEPWPDFIVPCRSTVILLGNHLNIIQDQ